MCGEIKGRSSELCADIGWVRGRWLAGIPKQQQFLLITLMQGENAADISSSPRVQRLAAETHVTPGSLHLDAVE